MQVTAVVINWRTLDLMTRCVKGLWGFYPNLATILVDNDSQDRKDSAGTIAAWARQKPTVSAILNRYNYCDRGLPMPQVGVRECKYGVRKVFDTQDAHEPFLQPRVLRKLFTGGNVGHGPALHQVLMLCETPYLLTLDSDCIVQRPGFIEIMLEPFDDPDVYAVGRQVKLDGRGTAQPRRKRRKGHSHIHGSVMMLDVAKYRTLEPFVHYGSISVLNMPDARARGYRLEHYNIGRKGTAVHHLFRGSRKLQAGVPNVRSIPIMPDVLLDGLVSEFIGGYF